MKCRGILHKIPISYSSHLSDLDSEAGKYLNCLISASKSPKASWLLISYNSLSKNYLFPLHRIIFSSGFLMDDLISLQFQSHPGRFRHFSFTAVHVTKTWFEVNNLVSKPTARFTGTPPQLHKSGSTLTKHLNKCLNFCLLENSTKKKKIIQQSYQIHPFVLA